MIIISMKDISWINPVKKHILQKKTKKDMNPLGKALHQFVIHHFRYAFFPVILG
jgi:hypothetical protein